MIRSPFGEFDGRAQKECQDVPQPSNVGACCASLGQNACISNVTAAGCASLLGTFKGVGTTCVHPTPGSPGTPGTCGPSLIQRGACCGLPGGVNPFYLTCADGFTPAQCSGLGGFYRGNNTVCPYYHENGPLQPGFSSHSSCSASNPYPGPQPQTFTQGACCKPDGSCANSTDNGCAIQGGDFSHGIGCLAGYNTCRSACCAGCFWCAEGLTKLECESALSGRFNFGLTCNEANCNV